MYVTLFVQQLRVYVLCQIVDSGEATYLPISFVQTNWQNNIIRNFSFVSKEIWNILWTLLLCSVALHMRTTILWKFKKCLYCLGAFAKLLKAMISFVISDCPSVRSFVSPHRIARLPLDIFPWNFMFEYVYKICREFSNFINIFKKWRVLCVET
jgi:hypothetical protein